LVKQFIQFSIVGLISTGVQYLLLWLGVHYLSYPASLASAVGFVLSSLINYALNYRFTFGSNKPHLEAAGKFFAVAGTGLVLNTALMYSLTVWLHWHYMLSQVATTGVVLLWNFAANRIWTFSC
jgi:putative flippase GtrA